jgi:hypothetical protein
MAKPDRPQLPTVGHPDQPGKFYFRLMYHTFFFGPFSSPTAVGEAMKALDAWDSWWDYDCVTLVRGTSPLPSGDFGEAPQMTDEEKAEVKHVRGRHG